MQHHPLTHFCTAQLTLFQIARENQFFTDNAPPFREEEGVAFFWDDQVEDFDLKGNAMSDIKKVLPTDILWPVL
jgi:hypothetical protein